MNIVSGNVVEMACRGEIDVLVHGCNCFHTMGAGVALQVKNTFPSAFVADMRTAKGDINKLGTISTAKYGSTIIVNAYTQYQYGGSGVHVNLDAVRNAFKAIKQMYPSKHIGMPKIGTGLAGGNWVDIEKIVKEVFEGENVTVVEYDPLA